jgi:hypothetical protein
LLAAVIGVLVGVPVALSFITGSIGLPHNDAWSHSKIAQHFARTGVFELVGWNRTALAGQIIPLGPLGRSITAQQLFVSFLAAVGLFSAFIYMRRRVGFAGSIVGVIAIGIAADFGLLSTSYMSDIPAFTALMICLVLTDYALARSSVWLLTLALGAGVWAVTIREQSLAGPVAALLVCLAAWKGIKRWVAAGLGAATIAGILVFEVWRRALPNGDPPAYIPQPEWTESALRFVFTLALFLGPVCCFAFRPRNWSHTAWLTGLTGAALALITAVGRGWDVFLVNYLTPDGAYPDAGVGYRGSIIPASLWSLLVLIACFAIGVTIAAFTNAILPADPVSTITCFLLLAGTFVQVASGQPVRSRFLISLIPMATAMVLQAVPKKTAPRPKLRIDLGVRLAVTAAVVAVIALSSFMLTANAMSYDATRWDAAEELVDQGKTATDINAGIEWVGYHVNGPVWRGPVPEGASGFWMGFSTEPRECYVVSASPMDLELLREIKYRKFALYGDATVYVYQRDPCIEAPKDEATPR